jgi:hypothetical protein
MTGSRRRRIQKIAHRGDRLPIASDDFPDIGSPHFYLEQDLGALFNLRYQHFVRCFDQVLNHEFQEVLHASKSGLGSSMLFASLANHTGNGLARLGAVLHPVISAIQINFVVLSRFSRIVIANYFNKFAIARASFVRDDYPIKRSVPGALPPQSNRNCHRLIHERGPYSSPIF